jgi:hypothetical protein
MSLETPTTLKAWRRSGLESEASSPRDVWDHLEHFFRDHGFLLWNKSSQLRLIPPNDEPRCPDGFSYRTVYDKESRYGFNAAVSEGFHAIAHH